jgi:transposase-like protein
LTVVAHTDQATLETQVTQATRPQATVYTDDWIGSAHLPELDRVHATVCHTPEHREWARDDDGDGIREVHNHTMEGIWTGLRNFLRPFRGVSKCFLGQYVALFEWGHNLKTATDQFLRALLGIKPSTA